MLKKGYFALCDFDPWIWNLVWSHCKLFFTKDTMYVRHKPHWIKGREDLLRTCYLAWKDAPKDGWWHIKYFKSDIMQCHYKCGSTQVCILRMKFNLLVYKALGFGYTTYNLDNYRFNTRSKVNKSQYPDFWFTVQTYILLIADYKDR